MPPVQNRQSPTAGMRSVTRPGRTPNSPHTSPVLASSGSPATADQGSLTIDGQAPETREPRRAITSLGAWRSDGAARWLFIWPTVLFILVLSLFPLVASLALSLSKLAFHQGGVDLKFIGFANYQQLLFGLERSHFLGVLKSPSPVGWAIVIATVVATVYAWTRAVRSGQFGP